ncbi:MAG: AsnC family transcriptional regulator [Gammaproteobacteria bacterium]|nr:AsnC family transcriptional regulator [Gammaproteobacteria bacterium]MCH2351865.1 Lrp/AsnC family transcriptional regulator [Pseudomonadales bacterium]
MELDRYDLHILKILQNDSSISMQDLGAQIGLSHTPCWRRVKKLEEHGVIIKQVALLNSKNLDLDVNVFVHVTLRQHHENALNRFEEAVSQLTEVVECYTVSGETDFLLRVVVKDVEAYEKLLKGTLLQLPEVGNLSSTFALRQVKYTTEIPIAAS